MNSRFSIFMIVAAILPEFPMEYVTILWIAVFFLFSLCLLFIWSKTLVLFKRTSAIETVLEKCENLGANKSQPA